MSASKAIDWDYWLALRTVKVWEAVALSVDLDPSSLEWEDQGLHGRFMVKPHSFPSASIKEEFVKRLRLLATSLTDRRNFIAGPMNPSFHEVPLKDAATWLIGIGRNPIPQRLMQAAETTATTASAAAEPSNRATINLPAGKTFLTVKEIPALIAEALHPVPAEMTLGTKLTSEDWRHLKQQTRRLAAEEQHKKQLYEHIRNGKLQAFSPAMTLLAPNEGAAPFARIMIEDLRPYLESRVRLTVRVASATISSPAQEMAWRDFARSEGKKIHKATPKLNLEQIAERVQQKLKASKILGRGGKVPSALTIKRHALRGIKK